jgi:hypothetical protein
VEAGRKPNPVVNSLSRILARSTGSALLTCISLLGSLGFVQPTKAVVPIEPESAVTRSLDELGKQIAALGRTNMLPIVTCLHPPLATSFPDAPNLVNLVEGALDHVRAGVRYVPMDLLGGVVQSNQTPVIFLKLAITAYDRGITNKQTTVGISLLLEAWRKFLSAEGQIDLEKEATLLAFSITVIGPDGILIPERGASLEALLFRERRGRRAFLAFNGSGGNLIQGFLWLDGPHSALRVLAERGVAQVLARLLEIDLAKCSGIDQFDERLPRFWKQSWDGFDTLRRVVHVQLLLRANGFQYVAVTGLMDEPTTAAIDIFRTRRNLPPRSELDADLFVELNMAVPSPAAEIVAEEERTIRVQFTGSRAAKALPALMNLWSAPGLGLVELREFTPQPSFGARVGRFVTLGSPKPLKYPEFILRLSGEAPSWRIDQAIRESASKLMPRFEWRQEKGIEKLLVNCD